MKFLRLLLCALLLPLQSADAWIHGGTVPLNTSRVTLNVGPSPAGYLNIAKTVGWYGGPANCSSPPCYDSNGYPNQKPTAGLVANVAFPANYYGTFTWSWSGTGSMQYNNSNPAIFTSISPSGAVFEMGAVSSGDHAPGTYCFCSQSLTAGVSNPTIVFQLGWNVQSISNNGSGLIRINTKANYVNNSCFAPSGTDQNGNVGPLVNITGANANTGANGLWAMTNCVASSFDLVGSAFTNAQAGVGGTAIISPGSNASVNVNPTSNNWTGFSNLVIAKTGDIAAINAGHYWDTTFVSQLQALMNPNGNCVANHDCGWLRWMDLSGVQANYESNFSQRLPTTAIGWAGGNWYPSGYLSSSAAAAITNGGAGGAFTDNYTTGDPSTSTWNGSAYIDGAVVQGVPSATNSGNAPSLNVGAHGAKPILQYNQGAPPLWTIISGVPATPGTDTMSFTFAAGGASWLNSGSNCSGTYTTQATDTSISNLSAHLQTWFSGGTVGANPTLTCLNSSKVSVTNPGVGPILMPPTAQAGRLTATYTSVADPNIVSPGTMQTSQIGSSGLNTFQYNYLLDAWIRITAVFDSSGHSSEFVFSIPYEAVIDLSNQVGANVYWNFGTSSSALITSVVQLFGDPSTGLTGGLKFGFEFGNEMWNGSAFPFSIIQTFGAAFGLTNSGLQAVAGYTGLRTRQYRDIALSAWTGQGRSASDFYALGEWQTLQTTGGTFDTWFLQGTSIGTANTFVATYGALGGGTVSTNYAASPNRPVDILSGIGSAPYWQNKWWGSGTSFNTASNGVGGNVSQNAIWLQAALTWAQGSPSSAYSTLLSMFNRTAGTGPQAGGTDWVTVQSMFTDLEAVAHEYDCAPLPNCTRASGLPPLGVWLYEGGPSWAVGSDGNNGVNSVNSADINALANRITALGWDVSPYTQSATNNATEMATMTMTMQQAWKNDSSYASMIDTYYYQALKTTSGTNREVHAAQFGYNGNQWGLFPGNYHFPNQYQNYNAISIWNAGN